MSFAHTKIQCPQPRSALMLPRPSLERELVAALRAQRVVLLCAPAGYGKTALLVRALQQLPERHAVAWISLDPGDDLRRLLECLVAALEPFDPPWRTAPEGLIAAADRAAQQPAASVDELVNTLEACDVAHGVIVLDDLHHVDDPACLGFLALLLQRLGPRWTVAITARHEPALRLARLRALGELTDIGQAQLQFSPDEVGSLLEAAGHDSAQATGLHERTGGWAAGLRLALGGARGSNLRSAIDRQAFEFLTTEVLERIDPALREFLLLTSVLHDLDAARCAAVSGDADAARKLGQIERLGLFASVVDDELSTLRLHDLFRDALQHRLRVERPDDWVALHERAAAVEADPVRRQALLLAAGKLEEAARALVAGGTRLLSQGAVSTVLRLYEQFPHEFAQASAELQLLVGEAKWAIWEVLQAERHLARAEVLFQGRGDTAMAQRTLGRRAITLVALGRLQEAGALIESLRAQQPTERDARRLLLLATTWHVLESAEYHSVAQPFMALVQCLEEEPLLERWNNTIPPPRQTPCRGIAPALARWAAGAMAAAGDRPVPLQALATLTKAWIALWQGRLEDAQDLLARADADAQWIGQQNIARNQSLGLHALLDLMGGRPAEALEAMRLRVAEHVAGYGDWGLWHSLFFACRVAAGCGDRVTLGDWVRRLTALQPSLPDATPGRLRPAQGLQGTLAWLEGRREEAMALWQAALDDEAHVDLLGQANELRVRLAHALVQTAPPARALPEAAALLQPMLQRVVDGPGGALFAQASLAALAAVDWQGHLAHPQVETLRAWARQPKGAAGERTRVQPPVPAADAQPHLLSAREWEVLGYIANGDSNKLIARAMDLSPFTVKRHVANILDKLGVSSRGQAAAWYRAQADAAPRRAS